jgi:uncharacterized OsmC-like protein
MMMAKAASPMGLDLRGMKIEAAQEYEMGVAMRLTKVHIRFHLPVPLTPDQEKALRAGAELCPVHTALRPDVAVTMELIKAS